MHDNGKGIPPDKLPLIFKEKESDQTGDNWDGCGLGLPVCQQLAEAINAKIFYNSILNTKTSFILVIKKADFCSLNSGGNIGGEGNGEGSSIVNNYRQSNLQNNSIFADSNYKSEHLNSLSNHKNNDDNDNINNDQNTDQNNDKDKSIDKDKKQRISIKSDITPDKKYRLS